MEAEAVEQTTVKSTVDPTVQLAEEYAQYMCVDTPGMHEFMQEADLSIEGLLARMEEYRSTAEMMKSETEALTNEMLPLLLANCQRLLVLFEGIDKMEKMVYIVRNSVDDVERDVVALEKAQTMQPIKSMIKSFASTFLRKKPVEEPKAAPYKAPVVFSTQAFFPCEQSTL